jgi:hypothetical protein
MLLAQSSDRKNIQQEERNLHDWQKQELDRMTLMLAVKFRALMPELLFVQLYIHINMVFFCRPDVSIKRLVSMIGKRE